MVPAASWFFGGEGLFVYTVISGMTAPRESRCKLGSIKVSPAHSRLRLMNLLYRVYIKAAVRPVLIRIGSAGARRRGRAAVRAGGSAGHIFLRHAPALHGLQRQVSSGRLEPGLPAANCYYWTLEAPFSAGRAVSGRIRAENERKKTRNGARNPSGDPEIALDMVVRGVIFSDNNSYKNVIAARTGIAVKKRQGLL